MVCLDTSLIIDFLKGKQRAVSAMAVYSQDPEGLSTTSITLYELLKYGNQKEREKALEFVARLRMHNFDETSANPASSEFLALQKKGTKINELDVLIAGIAKANSELLLTSDHDFEHLGDKNVKIID